MFFTLKEKKSIKGRPGASFADNKLFQAVK